MEMGQRKRTRKACECNVIRQLIRGLIEAARKVAGCSGAQQRRGPDVHALEISANSNRVRLGLNLLVFLQLLNKLRLASSARAEKTEFHDKRNVLGKEGVRQN
jgi:hypothetical protein